MIFVGSFMRCMDYGPTMRSFREAFWEELGAIRGLWLNLWCVGGILI